MMPLVGRSGRCRGIRSPGCYRGGGFIVARATFRVVDISGSAVNRLAAIGIGGNRE